MWSFSNSKRWQVYGNLFSQCSSEVKLCLHLLGCQRCKLTNLFVSVVLDICYTECSAIAYLCLTIWLCEICTFNMLRLPKSKLQIVTNWLLQTVHEYHGISTYLSEDKITHENVIKTSNRYFTMLQDDICWRMSCPCQCSNLGGNVVLDICHYVYYIIY